jgi:broad specificity phosphatase PhoE
MSTIPEEKTVWVLRHGLREDCHHIKWCDKTAHMVDPDLQPLGVEMAKAVAERLAGEKIDHILSSPFIRTIHTAAYIARKHKLPIKVEYGFHELIDAGSFPDGIPRLPLPEAHALRFPEIDLSYESRVYPLYQEVNGVDGVFHQRVGAALDAVIATLPGNILIMTHYAVSNCIKRHITGSLMDGFIELTSIFKYVMRNGTWQADMLADASHIAPLAPKA